MAAPMNDRGRGWVRRVAARLLRLLHDGHDPLRAIAIASNVAFIAYGLGRELYPLLLHAVLLPLNVVRLLQMRGSSVGRATGAVAMSPSTG